MNSTQYALEQTEMNVQADDTLQHNTIPVTAQKETQMNAIGFHQYGPPEVLTVERVSKPIPKENEILVKVHATSANAGDWHLMRGDPFLIRLGAGLRKPKTKILGADVAGRVEAVGSNVTQFRPGDAVFGDLSRYGFGAFAEYVAAPEDAFVLKPADHTFAQAAAVPEAAVTALQALRDHGQLQAGQKVLINGASGGVGTFAVQIAKALGAEVTAVCSTRKMEMVRSIGADHVIDYTKEDFTKNGRQYDLIVAVGGNLPLSAYRRALSPQGIYVMIGGSSMKQLFQAMLMGPLLSMTSNQKLGLMLVKPNQADLAFVAALLETGKVVPVIDKVYPFSDLPDAIRYLEAGHAQGKVVIDVASPASK